MIATRRRLRFTRCLEKCLAHVQQPTTVELPAELQLKAASRKWLAALAIGARLHCFRLWRLVVQQSAYRNR